MSLFTRTLDIGQDGCGTVIPCMVKTGRQKNRPNTLVSAASVRWRTLAEKVYSADHLVPVSRIEFAADRTCNYVRDLALDNQLVASES